MKPDSFRCASAWLLRLGLAASFLSASADRFGLWGPPGSPGVSWGDWQHFRAYSDQLNGWLPAALHPVAAIAATAMEITLGVMLLTPWLTRWVAGLSGVLLLSFTLTMTFTTGPKGPLDYSVWTAAGAAFLLAATLPDSRKQLTPPVH